MESALSSSFATPTGGDSNEHRMDDEDENVDNDGFRTVVDKKKEKRSGKRSRQNSNGRNTSTPRSTTITTPTTKPRDLTVFIKGCHRSLALFIRQNWTSFETEFNNKFHAPASFKVTGHCLKVVCCNQQQKETLLQCEDICGETIKVTLPFGVIRDSKQATKKYVIHEVPTAFTDDYIRTATKADRAKRLISNKTGTPQPTGVVVIDLKEPVPRTINIGAMVFRIRDYIPRPARCTRCNSFTHRQHQCTQQQRCVRCNSDAHDYNDCPARDQPQQLKCKNCGGAHSAAFRGCPVYVEIQDILKLKTKQHMTYKEAAQQIREEKDEVTAVDAATTKTTSTAARRTGRRNDNNSQKRRNTAKTDTARKQLHFPDNQHTAKQQRDNNVSRRDNEHNKGINKIKTTTGKADANTTLIVLLYQLSSYIVDIAAEVKFSNTGELERIATKLYNLGCNLYGEDKFGSEVIDLEADAE